MHKNNFDFLRLFLALSVVISHSYAVTGFGEADMLHQLTGGNLNLGALAVKGFFVISGYLIYESFQNSEDWFSFMIKRVLRIFPAFTLVVVLCAVAGIFLSKMDLQLYWNSGASLRYIADNLAMGFSEQKYLPGVFEDNPNTFVNASLWTIAYEWLMYCFLAGLFVFKKFPAVLKFATVGVYLFFFFTRYRLGNVELVIIPGTVFNLNSILNFGILFFSGCVMSVIKISTFRYRLPSLIALAIFAVFMAVIGKYQAMQYLVLPVVVILFGSYSNPRLSGVRKMGDLSYGVYLYGFPVQQILMSSLHLGTFQLIALCVPLVLGIAYLSWHLLEKKALRFKNISLNTKAGKPMVKSISKLDNIRAMIS